MIALTGRLRRWSGAAGSWHFVSIPESLCAELRGESLSRRRGFGSVRVEARIRASSAGAAESVTWRTSVFPEKSGGYVLPVKMGIRRGANLAAGDLVALEIAILD